MHHKPLTNAILATGYISIVATFMFYVPRHFDQPDNVLMPIAMLSLFVLSAAVMCYLFLLKPLQLYLDGQKQEAVSFFTRTLGSFAAITALVFIVLFLVPVLF